MTAEEMFEELGYEKCSELGGEVVYKELRGVSRIIFGKDFKVVTCMMYNNTYGFTFDEILACAQWIKEHTETEEKGCR